MNLPVPTTPVALWRAVSVPRWGRAQLACLVIKRASAGMADSTLLFAIPRRLP